MKIYSHKELRVWQEAMTVAMEIFHRSRAFPVDEKYSLTDQVRRSSRSVAANIAEAWRKRRYEAAFLLKLNDTETEATETQVWVEFALRSGYLKKSEADALDLAYEKIVAQLVTMMQQPEKWVLPRKERS